jgi:hypothetical protein
VNSLDGDVDSEWILRLEKSITEFCILSPPNELIILNVLLPFVMDDDGGAKAETKDVGLETSTTTKRTTATIHLGVVVARKRGRDIVQRVRERAFMAGNQ